ncbi:hypothetical protein QBC46DRAFT_73874 [Diplogelasinospora grovesii]|uniref:Uncharacterized protein n=1 Tax=Diplogelasinospora grovesii TaxID=303347 RepID=A0AAN6MX30_9PEZI|nr:hypothetical protein QBC46DRAFT_73874 [Diplogelasinospora grovesii]
MDIRGCSCASAQVDPPALLLEPNASIFQRGNASWQARLSNVQTGCDIASKGKISKGKISKGKISKGKISKGKISKGKILLLGTTWVPRSCHRPSSSCLSNCSSAASSQD